MSDYHPELWNPMWSIASILNGLQSFFLEEHATTGAVVCSDAARRQLAHESLAHCERSAVFQRLFPEVIDQQRLRRADEAERRAREAPPALALAAEHDLAAAPPHAGVLEAAVQAPVLHWRTWSCLAFACVAAVLALPFFGSSGEPLR
jgi:ubiquitin-conjugating enzyme E2 J2